MGPTCRRAGDPVRGGAARGGATDSGNAAPVQDLLYARHFALREGFTYQWSRERPVVTEGTIVILDVEPEMVFPRQVGEPVLYIGSHPAQRVNNAYPSGVLLAIVPTHVDLNRTRIWFGDPELPERIDAAIGAAQHLRAEAAGIRPFAQSDVDAALELGGPTLALEDVRALDRELRRLFREYVP